MFLDLIEASYAMRWMGLVTLTAMAPVAWHRFQWHRRWLARGELEVEPARQDDLYSVPHDVVEAYVREFPGLDQGFYERIKNILQGKGLRWMGELEDRTWSRLLPGLRTCARVFINGSGEVTATATHFRLGGCSRFLALLSGADRDAHVVALRTELSDGRFVLTDNARGLNLLRACPAWVLEHHPSNVSLDMLFERHRENVQRACSLDPGVRVVRTTNLASVRESAMRFWRRAAERRSGRGSFDPVTSSNEEVLDALFR